MPKTIERVVGEIGNPIVGFLNNKDNSLTIAPGTQVTVRGTNIDTGQVVISDAAVTMIDYPTRKFSYAPGVASTDWNTPGTLRLTFKVAHPNNKPSYVPDAKRYYLYLQLNPQ